MFKVIPNGTNRLDIELSGKLDADDMKLVLDELESKSKKGLSQIRDNLYYLGWDEKESIKLV